MSDPEDAPMSRRGYYIENTEGARPSLKLIVQIDDKPYAQLELKGPGLLAVIARPDDPAGFWIEIVQPGQTRFVDELTPESVEEQQLRDWQSQVLFKDEVSRGV